MNTQDELIEWLRDAYAMEKAMEISLKKQMDSDETLQPLRDQFEVHHAETQLHAEAVEACLRQLGGNTSTLKTTLAETIEIMRNVGASFARDERVKAVLAAHAAEHFEIGCYTALAAGARHLGLEDIARICENILSEEKRMADWLEANLPRAVISYLQEPAQQYHKTTERNAADNQTPSPPVRHVADIDTPVEAGSDDDPAEAWINHDFEGDPEEPARQQPSSQPNIPVLPVR